MKQGTQPKKGENGFFQEGCYGFHIFGISILDLKAL
jgi:hypothetical protein